MRNEDAGLVLGGYEVTPVIDMIYIYNSNEKIFHKEFDCHLISYYTYAL